MHTHTQIKLLAQSYGPLMAADLEICSHKSPCNGANAALLPCATGPLVEMAGGFMCVPELFRHFTGAGKVVEEVVCG